MNIIEKLGISASPWIVGELTEHPQLEDCYAVFSKKDVPCRSNATSIAITGLMDDNKERLKTTLADAQLIATAPEMLEALIEVQLHNEQALDGYDVSDTIQKATNKSWEQIKELINA